MANWLRRSDKETGIPWCPESRSRGRLMVDRTQYFLSFWPCLPIWHFEDLTIRIPLTPRVPFLFIHKSSPHPSPKLSHHSIPWLSTAFKLSLIKIPRCRIWESRQLGVIRLARIGCLCVSLNSSVELKSHNFSRNNLFVEPTASTLSTAAEN